MKYVMHFSVAILKHFVSEKLIIILKIQLANKPKIVSAKDLEF